MLRNYIKLAFRNLTRQKTFSVINIAGLAIGLASSLTILLWVRDEISYDRFHAKADRTYRLVSSASGVKVAITPAPLAPAVKEGNPGIEYSTRVWRIQSAMMQSGENKFEENRGYYAEPSLFDVFDFELQYGDKTTALVQPASIILTPGLAIKYFGTVDAVGKVLRRDNNEDLTVTGILASPKGNSHLQFDYLLPWSYAATHERNIRDNVWGNFDFYNFVTFDQPRDETFIAGIEQNIDALFRRQETRVVVNFTLQPLTDIHLTPGLMADVAGNGSFQQVAIFSIIAVFILLIGCINFMNLSTARAARRAKEVGLRKVAGAVRTQLVRQFLGESILISAIALAAALILVALFLPSVNELTGKRLHIDISDPIMVGVTISITLVTGFLAGLYPAFILSAFTPIRVLKGLKNGTGGSVFRNVLVVSQFVISIFLLVGTTVVYQQLQFIRERDLGYSKENLLHLNIHGDVAKVVNTWRAAFKSNPETSNFTIASALPTNLVSGTASVMWPGKDPGRQVLFATLFIDENFVPVYEMEIVSGRNFNHEMRGDSTNLLINQSAARTMGFTEESALGQPIELWGEKGVVVGVVKDFNFKPISAAIEPMLLRVNRWGGGTVVVKAEANKTEETIRAMNKVWNSLETVYPFSFGFVDDDLDKMYASEKRVGTLFTAFAALAIFISCLGLYGLSMFVAEQRTREIGIRKALGASVGSIVYLLNTRFVIPIIAAMVIASPLAWYAMNRWLEGFAYRVSFNWAVVLAAGIVALLVSLLTVSYETVKAAKVNPVKSLRTE